MARVGLAACCFLLSAHAAWSAGPVAAQSGSAVNIAALATAVGGRGSTLERTGRLVYWISDSLTWSATDYLRRTPLEILARRQGNCADLASVLRIMLDSLGIRSRWVREINVQPDKTPRRQKTAEDMVAQRGNSMSVFGLQHNDHVWLEVWDDRGMTWFPADPAYGVVGFDQWLPARLALADRPLPRVSAVIPIAADMRAPFVVLAQEKRSFAFEEDRTTYYLIEEFDRLYNGKLATLPAWSDWVATVRQVSPHARGAFEGKENLHLQTDNIARLKLAYDSLTAQAAARRITWR